MRKLLSLFMVFALTFGVSGIAFAHVSNELQIYQDLGASPGKEEITKLRALGIIPYIEGQDQFEPKAPLDRQTLATWLAKAAALEGHTDEPTPEEYAEEAVEYGFIENLEGPATYEDVVTGLLKIIGVKTVTKPAEQAEELGAIEGEWHDLVDSGQKANRENTAILFDMFLETKGPDGKSILDILGIKVGPTGTVDDVIEEVVTVDGEEKEVFSLTINGTEMPFYGEGKIALFENILAAKGNQVVQSYVKTIEEEGTPAEEMVIFIQGDGSVAAQPSEESTISSNEQNTQQESADVSAADSNGGDVAANANETSATDEEAEEDESGASVTVAWTIVILALLIVGVWIYASGRKKA